MVVKYCIVPYCDNNSLKNSKLVFIRVPENPDIRNTWYDAVNPLKRPMGNARVFICENHFDLENDAENWIKFKLMGYKLVMKSDIVPHRNLAKDRKEKMTPQISSSAKKRREANIETLKETAKCRKKLRFADEAHTSHSVPSEEILPPFEEIFLPSSEVMTEKMQLLDSPSGKFSVKDKDENVLQDITQAYPKISVCSVGTQVNFKFKKQGETSVASDISSSDSCSSSDESSYVMSLSSTSTDISPQKRRNSFSKQNNKNVSISNIERNSRFYLGIPPQEYFILKLITEALKTNYVHILISLKKIRLNDTFFRLAIEFGYSISNISKIFSTTVPLLANYFNDFIFWPDKHVIEMKLPVQFSIRYRNVQSVIDCFETEIQQPSNPYYQAQTWSNYKKCNTVKHLVSATPSGFINFISPGYCGRTSDVVLLEKSGYLDVLPSNCSVMADRGFKNIVPLLVRKSCKLVRPPSVSTEEKMTKEQVLESKRIAALRIHIERAIRRIREFKIFLPHACVRNKLIPLLDYIIIIVCGIINIQGLLIK